jgi:cyclopropane fatty-acyl-phospholipid synthase-like methyltransferase
MRLLTGKMPDLFYQLMVLVMKIQDLFSQPGNVLQNFNIQKGDRVLDLGCGPGRYLQKASELVGETGRVYAADIHPIAIDNVKQRMKRFSLRNVIPIILPDEFEKINKSSVDIVYALDMFHHISDAKHFLNPIHSLMKKNGRFFLEDGHQSRAETKKKVKQSELWRIVGETSEYVVLVPK